MPEKLTDEQLLNLVENEFDAAMGSPGSEISFERAKAWQYYLSKPLGNEVEGQSQIVTSDVADVVDGLMPSLLRIFTISDNLITFDPVGNEDVAQAQQESDYVNHVFFKQNDAFMILYTWFFDALLQKNGIVKAWWDESEVVTRESYKGLTDGELAELMDDEELEPIEREEREEDVTAITEQVTGMEAREPITTTVHDVVFERRTKKGRVRVMPVPPEEYRVSSDCRTLNPADARFVGHEREVTRSELIEMGFDPKIVKDLPATGLLVDTEEERERRDRVEEQVSEVATDKSQELVTLREAYYRVDFDGDGRSELRQVFTAGGKMLEHDEVDRQPFHVISPIPLPHKHFGRASGDKVTEVQRITTALIRQIHDNLYHSNNPSTAVWEQAMGENTLDDLLTTRVGSFKRFSRPVDQAYAQMTVPFTAGQAFPMIEYWDKVKRDRTGVRSDGEGLDPEALKNIQSHVLSQASDLSGMKTEAIVRIFAETGIKSLFLHIHELVLKHQKKAELIQLRGEFVQVDPREWRTRMNMTVQIGLGIGTKEANLLHLNDLWQKQLEAVNAGVTGMVNQRNLFQTGTEIVRNANLKNPERFFSDPGDAGFDQQGQEQQQLQQQLLQAQIQLAQQERQLQAREQDFDREKFQLQHEREVENIRIQREKMDNDFAIKLDQIATQLTELELKYAQNVPGAKV